MTKVYCFRFFFFFCICVWKLSWDLTGLLGSNLILLLSVTASLFWGSYLQIFTSSEDSSLSLVWATSVNWETLFSHKPSARLSAQGSKFAATLMSVLLGVSSWHRGIPAPSPLAEASLLPIPDIILVGPRPKAHTRHSWERPMYPHLGSVYSSAYNPAKLGEVPFGSVPWTTGSPGHRLLRHSHD